MAININFYNKFRHSVGAGLINLSTHQFKIALLGANHSFVATHEEWLQVATNEIANGNGYLSGGKLLTNVTWTESGGYAVFDADDAIWTATGASLGPAHHAVIYSDTSSGDKLVCSIAFNEAKIAGNGTDFRLTWNANGIFRW